MTKRAWKALGILLAVLLLGSIAVAADQPPNPEPLEPVINTLRVYGEAEHSQFPYYTYQGPFDLTSVEAPEKDFVVFNPAILQHDRFEGPYWPLFRYIKANEDASQKVHLRMWYERDYEEPVGATHPEVTTKEESHDVIFEYTYILLEDSTLQPTTGAAGQTRMAFPIASGIIRDDNVQPGLDRYDVDGDGNHEIMEVVDIECPSDVISSTAGTITVSPRKTAGGGDIRLAEGEVVEFLDYAIQITDTPSGFETKAEVRVWYTGRGYNDPKPLPSGVVEVATGDEFVVQANDGPVVPADLSLDLEAVNYPFGFEVISVGTEEVGLRVYRKLQAGESFFVDGAEYDVAAIFVECVDDLVSASDTCPVSCDDCELKYITIRNPIPKEDDVYISTLSVTKKGLPKDTNAWMLPPFNHTHDMVDDTNSSQTTSGVPDNQGPDTGIASRIVIDTDPYDIVWIKETTEPRFDTNLLEEKLAVESKSSGAEFLIAGDDVATEAGPVDYRNVDGTYFDDSCDPVVYYRQSGETEWLESNQDNFSVDPETGMVTRSAPFPSGYEFGIVYCYTAETDPQGWQWINIDTNPDHYTEFILPERPDVTDTDNEDGDYILVSSFETQDDVRVKFVYDAAVGEVHSADVYVNDANYNLSYPPYVDANSLRVYGKEDLNAAEFYETWNGPFDLTSLEAPEKDFVVHNPAYLDHRAGGLFGYIQANGDAHQKVHLRTWYVPEYEEPAGTVCGDGTKQVTADIVNEYTYVLLSDDADTFLDPTHGTATKTKMVFPMVGGGEQIGLEGYDVNDDGIAEIMSIEQITVPQGAYLPTTEGELLVSPAPTDGLMRIEEGGQLDFFDFRVKLVETATAEGKANFDIEYLGERYQSPVNVGSVELWSINAPILSGPTAAIVEGYPWDNIITDDLEELTLDDLDEVCRPFGFVVKGVGTNHATIKPYRRLAYDETFFVDGAEYDVAAVGVVESTVADFDLALKYITIRNPLPKTDVYLAGYTIWKEAVEKLETIPVLPPFNMTHDRIDDINIPELGIGSDVQYDDNLLDELETCGPEFPAGFFWGCDSGIHELFNTIEERVVREVVPLEFFWIREQKETRFDTNLMEEKFTICDGNEQWKWINIETQPWSYTEFVLPGIPDKPQEYGLDILGDYILVSSWTTQDGVRAKFDYDPSDGTGIYVNTITEEPAPPAPCDPPNIITDTITAVPATQLLNEPIVFSVNTEGEELWYEWNFGDGTVLEGADLDEVEHAFTSTGDKSVSLTLSSACSDETDTAQVTVTIVNCDPVESVSLTSDSPRYWGQNMTFNATVTGGEVAAYSWDFGDDGEGELVSGGEDTGVYKFAAIGEYTVELTVTGACLGREVSDDIDVLVEQFPGDVNGDCTVNVLDVQAIVARWFSNDTDDDWDPIYDFTGPEGEPDGKVNVLDVQYVVNRMGTSCSD